MAQTGTDICVDGPVGHVCVLLLLAMMCSLVVHRLDMEYKCMSLWILMSSYVSLSSDE